MGTVVLSSEEDNFAALVTPSPAIEPQAVRPITTCRSLNDLEIEGKKTLSRQAYVFYDSAAETLTAWRTNKLDWTKITFRPRILRNVAQVSMKRRIMGHHSELPCFIAPAALAKLGHKDGEFCLVRGAARFNIPYCTSTYTSIAHKDLSNCLREQRRGGALFYQLYVPLVKSEAKKIIAEAKMLGFKALVVTVDVAVVGIREEDDRHKAELDHERGFKPPPIADTPFPSVLRSAHSPTLDWDDMAWIRKAWGDQGPVVIKGIQTAEDALLAAQSGVDAVYLSNHGGRQLDYAPSSIQTLLEIRRFCPEVLKKVEIYVDGGVTRGSDIIKALCLGATAVGLGRPFLYALTAYGTEGVYKAIQSKTDLH
jgi:L-lactate dehydrogenase (cytochrome)